MFKKPILLASISLLLLSACSDVSFSGIRSKFLSVDEFLIEAKGHWVHNELFCVGQIQSFGVHDVLLSEEGITVTGHLSNGHWAPVAKPEVYFDSIRDFAADCDRITQPSITLAFFHLDTAGQHRVVAVGDDHLFIINENEPAYHYTPFKRDMFEGVALNLDLNDYLPEDDVFLEDSNAVEDRFVIEVD